MKESLFLAELKQIFRNKKMLVSIIAVMIVPLMYAGMFLWAFWDPYEQMEQLPVAIVNLDEGAEFEGTELQIGNELVEKLRENKVFDFHFVDQKEGYAGLNNQQFYLLVEIPPNFSENATTLLEDEPEKLTLKYVPNESANFLAGQIGETAINEIKAEISKNVTATYAETFFDRITEMASGLEEASDGAFQINDGASKVTDGSKSIAENLQLLAEKSIEFNNGVNSASSGAQSLTKGTEQITTGLGTITEKMPQLINGMGELKNGVEQIQQQLPAQIAGQMTTQLEGSIDGLNQSIDEFNGALSTQLSAGLTEGIADSLSKALAEQTIASQAAQMEQLKEALIGNKILPEDQAVAFIGQMAAGSPTKDQLENQFQQQLQAQLSTPISSEVRSGMNEGFAQFKTELGSQLLGSTAGLEEKIQGNTDPVFGQLLAGVDALQTGQGELQKGVQQLYDGSTELNSGANELSNGMNQLSSGSSQLLDGTNQLAAGSKELQTGASDLTAGTEELADKLSEGAEKAGSVQGNEKTYDMMGQPVQVEKGEINKVPNYGTGFAPYFISLGLFVGALLLSIVYALKEPAIQPRGALQWLFSKFGVIAGVGIIQAFLVDAILLFVLKIEVTSVPLFIVTSLITSFTFIALVQMLVTILGDPGRFIAIIVLILQLTTSAGTFPLELIPNALQPISALLPMTYSVQAFKAVISSGDYSFMWQQNAILLTYMAAFMTITFIYFKVKMKTTKMKEENVIAVGE
ncbi:YhgE/Pip domain-containing protein [Sutcliffiella sp. NC1]|uniref:YhgE/Pip domain-containing protein n=1 Tax=Sutcliffiella sp. NC1 TaxID=3004096 RepID=UPI0022DE7D97|nr:YhgE/Pip domain-containing protein [Sutcliffiella sp. NC1]WBL14864.1 YhgE/Pip domain-containing protein [Sutcliffiella sp. NC1]